MNPEVPGPLRALQVARLWTAGDPGWTEALFAAQEQPGSAGSEAGAPTQATWVPVAIAGRVSHLHVASSLREGSPVATGRPLQLRPAPPLRLRRCLEAALAEWPEIIDTDPPLRPRMLRLQRDGVLPLGENLASVLAEAGGVRTDALARARLEQWLEHLLRDYRGFELAGHEVGAGILAAKALAGALEARADGGRDAPLCGSLLHPLLQASRRSPPAEIATRVCTALLDAGLASMLVPLADALAGSCVAGFEQAKQVGLEDPSTDPDLLMRRVIVEPHLMLSLWDRLHEALHLLAPQLQAASLLLRVLAERPDVGTATALRLQRALGRVDELAVVALNSLLEAVNMQDPQRRGQHVDRIREERQQGGAPAVRQALRQLIEQQALFPRVLYHALDEASRDVA